MIEAIYRISAILGLICIIAALFINKPRQKREQYVLYIVGGALLEIYSISIRDTIFIILQLVFTLSAIYELSTLYSRAKKMEKNLKEYLIHIEKKIIAR